ncbi:MAG: ring-cleaving dioxygenase [Fimbriimonas sp.]
MAVLGIHHVTAVSSDIVRNLEFYTGTMGLRLVKKSVNQDDVRAYHLFYADEVASPGTDFTFFDWPTIGPNVPGPGTVSLTTFRVPGASLEAWEARLTAAGLYVEQDEDPRGRARLLFSDPEGQRLALVDGDRLPNDTKPWTAVVPAEQAIQGIFGVDLESARPDSTHRVLTDILGYTEAKGGEGPVYQIEGISEVRIAPQTMPRLGSVGAGGVHHVAFRVRDDAHLTEMQDRIEAAGLKTSGYVDRFWFHSLYFREPGGILFELATDGPGFGIDESMENLGETTVLAPFLEPRRAEIEANLKPLPKPSYLK